MIRRFKGGRRRRNTPQDCHKPHARSGGGPSLYEASPSYQAGLGYAKRANPDVAYDADGNTGFYVYDTYYSGGGGWFAVGGTSAGSPQWTGLVTIANQMRGTNGSLDGLSQTLPALYGAASGGAFHDITTGNNGYDAKSGYDLVTGVGSPFANTVIIALVNATATASGSSAMASASLNPSVKSGSADDPVLDHEMRPQIHVAAADVSDDVVTGHAGHHGRHAKHDADLTQSFGLRRYIA